MWHLWPLGAERARAEGKVSCALLHVNRLRGHPSPFSGAEPRQTLHARGKRSDTHARAAAVELLFKLKCVDASVHAASHEGQMDKYRVRGGRPEAPYRARGGLQRPDSHRSAGSVYLNRLIVVMVISSLICWFCLLVCVAQRWWLGWASPLKKSKTLSWIRNTTRSPPPTCCWVEKATWVGCLLPASFYWSHCRTSPEGLATNCRN